METKNQLITIWTYSLKGWGHYLLILMKDIHKECVSTWGLGSDAIGEINNISLD